MLLLSAFVCMRTHVYAQFTVPTGSVVGNQTVISIPVNPPGYATAQALIYYPDDYNLPANTSKRYPLYIFMHGANQGRSWDINEVDSEALPLYIANGFKPYAIDSLSGDTVKFIVVSPHCANCFYSFSYAQLQYTIPYLLSTYRVDTSCVWVGGVLVGGGSAWSTAMGANTSPPTPDTNLAKRLTGIMPLSTGSYEDAYGKTQLANALDTNLRRGLAVLTLIGDQDPAYNVFAYQKYRDIAGEFGLPGRIFHNEIIGGGQDSTVWNRAWPLSARVWSTTMNSWTQMWDLRKRPPVAYAGSDQTLAAGTTSSALDGSASKPGTGRSLTGYQWSQVSGPNTATISSPSAVSTVVSGLSTGTYLFSLRVTDNGGQSAADTLQVTVNAPAAPTGMIVRKVACTEYQSAFLYTDSSVRSFIYNGTSGHVEFTPFSFSTGKAVDISTGFNQIMILDDSGYVSITNAGQSTSNRVNTDATGSPFNNNKAVYGFFSTYMTIRADSSIWYWGTDYYHFYSSNNTMISAPVKLHIPPGVKFSKIATGTSLIGLTTTGDVYMWDIGDSNYKKVILPRPASDIGASNLAYFVAIVPDNIASSRMGYPYAWGPEYVHYLASSEYSYTSPFACKSRWGMTRPIKEIAVSENTIHYIDSLGNLYGLGDNVQGEIGNGQELVNHAELYPNPYAWRWVKDEDMLDSVVAILPGTTFKKIFTGNPYVYYNYALDHNDSLYFWGRNKSFVGGDGAVSNNESTYPNGMDILTPSLRTPIAITPTQTTSYNFSIYTLKAPAAQSITTSSTTLTATSTASLLTASGKPNYGYTITKYQWTKVSGPSGATITNPNSLTTTVTGLTTGTYIFNIQTTDNNTATISAKDTIVVSISGGSAVKGTVVAGAATSFDNGERLTTIYPNPVDADQLLTVEGHNWKPGALKITLLDLSGRITRTIRLENAGAYFRQTLSLAGLAKGSYLLSIQQDGGEKPEIRKIFVK